VLFSLITSFSLPSGAAFGGRARATGTHRGGGSAGSTNGNCFF